MRDITRSPHGLLALLGLGELVIIVVPPTGALGLVRVAAGAALALWIPGLALLLAVRPEWTHEPARHVLAVPLSLGIVALGGVAIDQTPLLLTPLTMILVAVVPAILFLAVAALRRIYAGDTDSRDESISSPTGSAPP